MTNLSFQVHWFHCKTTYFLFVSVHRAITLCFCWLLFDNDCRTVLPTPKYAAQILEEKFKKPDIIFITKTSNDTALKNKKKKHFLPERCISILRYFVLQRVDF